MNNWIPENRLSQSFMEELLDFMPEPIMITDEKGILLFVNTAFAQLVQKEAKSLYGIRYGDALGCKYFEAENQQCGNTYYCEICEIRQTLEDKALIASQTGLSDGQIIVREILVNGFLSTKIFELSVKPFKSDGKTCFVCLLKNLKKEDLENIE
jgi:PAS domain-containing protein